MMKLQPLRIKHSISSIAFIIDQCASAVVIYLPTLLESAVKLFVCVETVVQTVVSPVTNVFAASSWQLATRGTASSLAQN